MQKLNGWVLALVGLLFTSLAASAAVTNILALDNVMDTAQDYYNTAVTIGLGVILIGTVVGFLFKGLFLKKR